MLLLPQLLLEANGLGAEYHIKRVPACANTTNNYCERERLSTLDAALGLHALVQLTTLTGPS